MMKINLTLNECCPNYWGIRNLPDGIYLCMGEKHCFNCVYEFAWLNPYLDSIKQPGVNLIMETEASGALLQEEIKDIEQAVSYGFRKTYIDSVNYVDDYNSTCGYLCGHGIPIFPALIVVKNKQLKTFTYAQLFGETGEMDREMVKTVL